MPNDKKLIGIQIGAVSFVDEGTGKVLDILQERACVNALFLAVFSYGRGIAGRQVPGQPLPDHGKQEYDLDFHGGNYATVHPKYYKDTAIRPEDTRAPDHGKLDILEEVIPAARQRGIRTFLWTIDKAPPSSVPHIEKLQERQLDGRNSHELCFNNPYHRNFLLGLMEDYTRSYPIDGILWASERRGPLINILDSADASKAACFCGYCERKAERLGIRFDRVRAGYTALGKLLAESRSGKRPVDGHYVSFWRTLLRYPEIVAWETFWNDSLRETYAAIYGKVKSIQPNLPVGWHIAHSMSFSPIYRAEQDVQELSKYSDFLKMVMYHNCAGERLARYVDHQTSSAFADFPKKQLLEFEYRVMNYREPAYEQLPRTGLSADYVYRETKRCMDGAAVTKVQIWPGIDIDIPTESAHSKSTPQATKDAVIAAFRAGAPGIVLSRKYSEIKLANLSGAGDAVREMGLA